MKKIILILLGISILLTGAIFILYKNYKSQNEEIIDIFKDEEKVEENTDTEDKFLTEETTKKVVVDIKGMVANPGVYEVENTKRVNDVIEMAGGLTENADTSLINLAKIVTDEMTIIIYAKEEVIEKYKQEVCVCDCPLITNDACINNDNTSTENKVVNINTSSKEELMTISGLGETKAEAIIKYREENGNFNTIEDIKNVSGIGDSLFEKIKDYITV